MEQRPNLTALIEKHRLLDTLIACNREHFISDWNCDNPFLERLLGPKLFDLTPAKASPAGYIFFDDEGPTLDALLSMHLKRDGLQLSRGNILAGPGSSSLLAAFSLWLLKSGHTDVYYIPPLYYTLHYFLQMLNIHATPVSKEHAFQTDFVMNLPSRRTVLLLSDPIWYAGKVMPIETIKLIAAWQQKTGSMVFVDGSFQYMKWDGTRNENTSLLDPELTFRLVCPTKALAVPFFRFAYLLHPSAAHDEIVFLYENIIGGATASDLAFAQRALQIFASDTNDRVMTDFFRDVFNRLVERNLIRTTIHPECSYFVFAIPTVKLSEQVVMDQTYFELGGYPGHSRINLMSAHRIYSLGMLSDREGLL